MSLIHVDPFACVTVAMTQSHAGGGACAPGPVAQPWLQGDGAGPTVGLRDTPKATEKPLKTSNVVG